MGAGHAHPLYVHGHSAVHRMAPEVKIVVALGVVVAAALIPRQAFWAFAIVAVGLVMLAMLAGLEARFVLARMAAVLPFILFAFLIPFIAGGERVQVLGISMSRDGLWGMWNVIAKASIGIVVSIILTSTTEVADLLRGLARLRVPAVLTAIATFMVRYLEVIADQLGRMRTAMVSRGHDPRWLWQARPIAASAGTLFVRSYERSERIHAAMLSRGYRGAMPGLGHRTATGAEWAKGGLVTLAALTVAVVAVVIT